MNINPLRMLALFLVVVFLIIFAVVIQSVQADEVSDYIAKINPSPEAKIWISHKKPYRTYILYIRDGNTLYVKNIKRPLNKKRVIKRLPLPDVRRPHKRGTGNSLNMTGGYN